MNYKRILIFRIGHLGDTIVSLPAFWAIRNRFPDAELALLSNSSPKNPEYVLAKGVLPKDGLFDDWISYPSGINKFSYYRNLFSTLMKIKRMRFDAVFYLMTRNRTNNQIRRDEYFFNLAGIKNIFGVNYLRQNQLTFDVDRPLNSVESEKDFLLNCLKFDDKEFINHQNTSSLLSPTVDEKQDAENWLIENCDGNFPEKKTLVGIGPGSKWESKIWMEHRFYEVIDNLVREMDVFPIVFGGPEDREKGDRLIKKWGIGANAAGELNVRQAAAALEKCSIYLGNDTGTMHLAAAVKTPCVSVFASIDFPGRWLPFGDKNQIFRTKIECEGCHTANCFNDKKCLEAISVDEVTKACKKILEKLN